MSAVYVARLLARLIDKVPEIVERTNVRFTAGAIQRQLNLKELVGFTYKVPLADGSGSREFVVFVGERSVDEDFGDPHLLTGKLRHGLKLAKGVKAPDPNRPVSRGRVKS